ncbi:uncharacterized protein ATNIH1004_006323 [Aspergillus tanneri]|uniref:Spindle pole body-associated protein cut12 domain-containing protein n=1 Tax=Aspergillus tanneri TaxID=1220188 RepID=A0A5M9MSS2_9EURO|nr:uncharacterized protein ATNIH1004_006323 [Aspergillus tanneri]KAA8647629.1 hypothetical protein ATNIH1004_006323 [Aspergillus tanneri]
MLLTVLRNSVNGSKALEPPETPAPVFAIRAFKSALFGTPGADDDENSQQGPITKNPAASVRQDDVDSQKLLATGNGTNAPMATAADVYTAVNAMASPTKSILVTPGTASNRRKTVSFGESVVDNERKRAEPATRPSRTQTVPSGSLSSQWSSSSSNGKSKPRSRLTQALMDSRENTSIIDASPPRKVNQSLPPAESKDIPTSPEEDPSDDTVNLNEPRSQSGKYWKAEFDSYRTKTTREIRKLIQYRSAAKSYARKKDEEAVRLAEKLKEEEVKVSEMERHVTQLASTMVTEKSHPDKEKLVQDLTKQTALALQYKHRVGLLRKLLERHGVVGSEIDDIPGSPDLNETRAVTGDELRKTQQALDQANAKIAEINLQQSEFTNLRDLAQSSEKKASELEKENVMLKQTLARVKQEMTKYEARRKEKEAKLKQRETRLETRIQEYRERLRTASQQHRELEDDLKASFDEERRHMQEQIDLLSLKVATLERLPELRARRRTLDSPRKNYPGVEVCDFAHPSPHRDPNRHDETTDVDEPLSPSPRAKDRRSLGPRTALAEIDVKKASKGLGLDDNSNNERLMNMGHYTHKAPESHFHDDEDPVPPSSPPDIPSFEPTTRTRAAKQKYQPDSYRPYLPSHTTMTSLAHRLANMDDSQRVHSERLRSRRSTTRYSLDALSALPEKPLMDRPRKRQSLNAVQRGYIPIERMIAAQARLKHKNESRKSRDDGKENIQAYNS